MQKTIFIKKNRRIKCLNLTKSENEKQKIEISAALPLFLEHLMKYCVDGELISTELYPTLIELQTQFTSWTSTTYSTLIYWWSDSSTQSLMVANTFLNRVF